MDIYANKKAVSELNSVYMEAVYGQSAGQKLAQRERDDDAAGAPNKKKAVKEESQAKQEISDLKKAAKTFKGKYVALSLIHI